MIKVGLIRASLRRLLQRVVFIGGLEWRWGLGLFVGEEFVDRSEGKVFLLERFKVIGVIGGDFEEAAREIAVFRTRQVVAAGAMFHR